METYSGKNSLNPSFSIARTHFSNYTKLTATARHQAVAYVIIKNHKGKIDSAVKIKVSREITQM